MDPFIGQIMQVGFRYAPVNWLACNGVILQVNQYNALYALLGNTFGGNGKTDFGLPDARGRTMLGTGQGPGLTPRNPGANGGGEAVALNITHLPVHNHSATFQMTGTPRVAGALTALKGLTPSQQVPDPENNAFLGKVQDPDVTPTLYVPAANASLPGVVPVQLAGVTGTIAGLSGAVTVGQAGQGAAFSVMSPFLAVTTIIATVGIWPERPD